jgi:hypothetical protein
MADSLYGQDERAGDYNFCQERHENPTVYHHFITFCRFPGASALCCYNEGGSLVSIERIKPCYAPF